MPPPSFAKPATAPAPAATTAPVATKPATAPAPVVATPAATAAPVVPGAKKPRVSKYGPATGTVPTVGDCDPKALFDALMGAISTVDIAAFSAAFDKTPATAFPGRKEGRAAYMLCNVICRLGQIGDLYSAKPTAPRNNAKKKTMLAVLKKLKALAGDAGLAELQKEGISLEKLGISLEDLQAE